MNAGICVCVLLAAFSGSSLGRPSHSQDEDKPEPPQLDSVMSPQHTRHTRSAPSSGQLIPFSKPAEDEAEDPRISLRELLGRLISRKGSLQRSSSLSSRASGPGPSHKIKDRDYLGWMDFGRRSAEEYEEYSS
ncbi:cholecystokinin a [Oncorhynchus keta]|uniref:cholecystokinin a n=1 Tax=Oncorhynchus keta TaxID=8018 RepID=UPI00227CBA03|nr:cholecystokinin a [Oncorhynchus keta]